MGTSASEQCRACIEILKTIIMTLSKSEEQKGYIRQDTVDDELERFSLWIGNIGALHQPASSLSLESRLREAKDILAHILEILEDLNEVAKELSEILSGEREGGIALASSDHDDVEDQHEETELFEELRACITRLFRASSLIRPAAPTDLFAKALSRTRYRFSDQFDIAHVGKKFPKLATEESAWLQRRLGRAITQRRHYLSYVQDHRERLEQPLHQEGQEEAHVMEHQGLSKKETDSENLKLDSSSRPSTFFTRASTLVPDRIDPKMLFVKQESDSEDDTRSYTTITRSVDGGTESSALTKIPRLNELRSEESQKEFECPFCLRTQKFKSERLWKRHVFGDLRSYVCTFPDCNAPYFEDINEWFQHEMQNHRVSYVCRVCKGKSFYLREKYLAHIRRQHADILEDGDEQSLLEISRQALAQIPAGDCPCCLDWSDRLRERTTTQYTIDSTLDDILTVSPTVFKRHVASHLEQLALFAVPISSSTQGEANSDVAVEVDLTTSFFKSNLSALEFDDAARSVFELGLLYKNQGKLDEAVNMFEQALEDEQRSSPPQKDHRPERNEDIEAGKYQKHMVDRTILQTVLMKTRFDLASKSEQIGDFEKAQQQYHTLSVIKAVEKRKLLQTGQSAPQAQAAEAEQLKYAYKSAKMLINLKRYDEAVPVLSYIRSRRIRLDNDSGTRLKATRDVSLDLCKGLLLQGTAASLQNAEGICSSASSSLKTQNSQNSEDLDWTLRNASLLTLLKAKQGHTNSAIELLRELWSRLHGASMECVEEIQQGVADLLKMFEQKGPSLAFREVLNIIGDKNDALTPPIVAALMAIGLRLYNDGNYNLATTLLPTVWMNISPTAPPDETLKVGWPLAWCYFHIGLPDDAKAILEGLLKHTNAETLPSATVIRALLFYIEISIDESATAKQNLQTLSEEHETRNVHLLPKHHYTDILLRVLISEKFFLGKWQMLSTLWAKLYQSAEGMRSDWRDKEDIEHFAETGLMVSRWKEWLLSQAISDSSDADLIRFQAGRLLRKQERLSYSPRDMDG